MLSRFPGSVRFNCGNSRLHDRMSPLVVACMNTNIPLIIIEAMLQCKVKPKLSCSLELDIDKNRFVSTDFWIECPDRRQAISDLFKEYNTDNEAESKIEIIEI